MSQIAQGQGAIKQSEVAVDEPQDLLGTQEREDGMTVTRQMRKVLSDSLRRAGLLLTSRNPISSTAGSIAWDGSTITFTLNTNIVVKFLQNESPDSVVDLVMEYGASDDTDSFLTLPLASGEILYVELDRANVTGPTVILENAVSGGSLVSGKTVRKGTSMPNLSSPQSGVQGTIAIPIAINIDGSLWWIPHGIYWPENVSSPLGAVVTTTSIPVGGIVPFHTFGDAQAYGYTGIKALAPGFQLCDGSVIIDPQSTKINPTRNADGTPTLSYNAALDKFTPNINGEHIAWSSAVTWTEGDYVIDGGTRYVAIQDVPTLTLITDTAYWQPEATYNNTSPVNPYNKYRKTTQNQALNSYLRGNNQSLAASSASAYGGENTHVLTVPELPGHTHTTDSQGGHTHTGTTDGGGSHNHGGSTGNALAVSVAPAGAVGYESGDDGAAAPAGAVGLTHSHSIPTQANHTHTFTTGTAGAHTHTAQSTGGGGAHNNEPRYHNIVYIVRIY